VEGYVGTATAAAYTVFFEGLDPVRTTVIADTPAGDRCIAVCADADLALRATREELIGTQIAVDGTTFRA